jgi:hypothetical protein
MLEEQKQTSNQSRLARLWSTSVSRKINLRNGNSWLMFRIRAERRAGELLIEMKQNGQRHSGRGNNSPKLESRDTTPTISDLGISAFSAKNEAVKALEPFPGRNQWRGEAPLKKLVDLASGEFALSDAAAKVAGNFKRQIDYLKSLIFWLFQLRPLVIPGRIAPLPRPKGPYGSF